VLIDTGYDVANHGDEALTEAASRGFSEMVRALLDRGAVITHRSFNAFKKALSHQSKETAMVMLNHDTVTEAQRREMILLAAKHGRSH
jgi:ankyrin repeat protein